MTDPLHESDGRSTPGPRYRVAVRPVSFHGGKVIPWWAVAAAGAGPVLLIGGFSLATAIQPASYNPVRDTISELAGRGATDSWVMTSALAGVGLCYLLGALGLQPAGRDGSVLLAGGGVATILIAVFQQPRHGYSLPHELAVIATVLSCCTWPAFAWHRLTSCAIAETHS